MFYTHWRVETNDASGSLDVRAPYKYVYLLLLTYVLGGFSTFHERYEFLQEDLKVHMQLYEPYVDEVKQAETADETGEVNNGILWR